MNQSVFSLLIQKVAFTKKTLNKELSEIFFMKVSAFPPAILCSKLTVETLEQGVKYVKS